MDEADIAAHAIEEAERQALLQKRPVGIKPIGVCHNCEHKFKPEEIEKLFCDKDCRDDFEKSQKFLKLKGAQPLEISRE